MSDNSKPILVRRSEEGERAYREGYAAGLQRALVLSQEGETTPDGKGRQLFAEEIGHRIMRELHQGGM